MSKPYVEFYCENISTISNKIYNFVKANVSIDQRGWIFLDLKSLLNEVPELLDFFKKHKLLPRDAAITILTETGQLPMHLDELPVVAKLNMPVANTAGWVNRWYDIDPDILANCPTVTNQFGNMIENLSTIPADKIKILTELHSFSQPVVFNSRIPHSVDKINATDAPRIIASFTFYNDNYLMELLK